MVDQPEYSPSPCINSGPGVDQWVGEKLLDPECETWRQVNSGPVRRLPPEILRLIFLRVVPPPFLLDSSLFCGLESPWCRAQADKESIVQVCRAWYVVGIEHLYQDIVLRRFHQLPLLIRTLEASPQALGHLVFGLKFSAYVPPHDESCTGLLQRVVDLCDNLAHFSFESPESFCFSHYQPAMKPSITCLTLRGDINHVLEILTGVCKTLVSLTMDMSIMYWPHDAVPLELPSLRTLALIVKNSYFDDFKDLTDAWCMPYLESLTLQLRNYSWEDQHDSLFFFKRHGRSLKSLQIHLFASCCRSGSHLSDIQPIIDECPALEHIVICPLYSPRFTHPLIKWVDVRLCYSPESICDFNLASLNEQITSKSLPALRRVRGISPAFDWVVDLPFQLPPDVVQSDADSFECRYHQLCVRHEPGHIFGGRSIDIAWEFGSSDGDTDSNYIYEDSESDFQDVQPPARVKHGSSSSEAVETDGEATGDYTDSGTEQSTDDEEQAMPENAREVLSLSTGDGLFEQLARLQEENRLLRQENTQFRREIEILRQDLESGHT